MDYLIYLPHFAFPLAASYIVIPLEQENRNTVDTTAIANKIFFIVYFLRLAEIFQRRYG